jgi:hypothetical protein
MSNSMKIFLKTVRNALVIISIVLIGGYVADSERLCEWLLGCVAVIGFISYCYMVAKDE